MQIVLNELEKRKMIVPACFRCKMLKIVCQSLTVSISESNTFSPFLATDSAPSQCYQCNNIIQDTSWHAFSWQKIYCCPALSQPSSSLLVSVGTLYRARLNFSLSCFTATAVRPIWHCFVMMSSIWQCLRPCMISMHARCTLYHYRQVPLVTPNKACTVSTEQFASR